MASLSHHFYSYSGRVENFFMSHCCCCCCFSTLHLSKICLLLLFVIFIVDNSPLCYTFFNAPSLIHINITNTEKKEFRLPLLWTDFTTYWFLVLMSLPWCPCLILTIVTLALVPILVLTSLYHVTLSKRFYQLKLKPNLPDWQKHTQTLPQITQNYL